MVPPITPNTACNTGKLCRFITRESHLEKHTCATTSRVTISFRKEGQASACCNGHRRSTTRGSFSCAGRRIRRCRRPASRNDGNSKYTVSRLVFPIIVDITRRKDSPSGEERTNSKWQSIPPPRSRFNYFNKSGKLGASRDKGGLEFTGTRPEFKRNWYSYDGGTKPRKLNVGRLKGGLHWFLAETCRYCTSNTLLRRRWLRQND